MNDYRIATELFAVRGHHGSLIYAPLLGMACTADGRLMNAICDLRENKPPSRDYAAQYDQLLSMGFITRNPGTVPTRKPPSQEPAAPFLPCEVTLFLTADCNLSCRYCYGNGGSRSEIMQEEIALAAVDLLFDNAEKTGRQEVRISFHGGGEPTLEFKRIQHLVTHARRMGERRSIRTEFGLTSNGFINPQAARWIIDNIDHINISFDGPADIQDFQRPTRQSQGSFATVSQTLQLLDAADKQYCIRGTITRYSENRIPEIADYITGNHKVHTIQFEPMFSVGRAVTSAVAAPEPERFIQGYLAAEEVCRQAGVTLKFSGHRFPRTSRTFCSIGQKNFAVTPEGLVTSCFEVLEKIDQRSDIFFFGTYRNGSFHFDRDKITALRKLSETLPEYCRHCFAQYHCTGDCRGKGLYLGTADAYRGGGRCTIIQGLIKEKLFTYFTETSQGESHGQRQ